MAQRNVWVSDAANINGEVDVTDGNLTIDRCLSVEEVAVLPERPRKLFQPKLINDRHRYIGE